MSTKTILGIIYNGSDGVNNSVDDNDKLEVARKEKKYYMINSTFSYLVQECGYILSANDIIYIDIPIILYTENFKEDIETYISDAINIYNTNNIDNQITIMDCNQFIYSGETSSLSILIDIYFRYYPEKILYSINSAGTGSDYNDNVFRLVPNNYGLNNFIANIYLQNKNFDLFYFTANYYTTTGTILVGDGETITTTQSIINEFLKSIGKTMIPNPIPFSINTLVEFNQNLKKNMSAYEYDTTNYYAKFNIPYVINTNALNDTDFNSEYYDTDDTNSLFYRVSDKAISTSNNGVITYFDDKFIPQIEKFISYLYNFNYNSGKSIVVFIAYPEFPILLSKLASRFSNDFMENMMGSLVFILSNIHNKDKYTWDLFNNRKTDTLWYNNGYTWYDILQKFNVKIHFPRTDQSMFYIYKLLNSSLKDYFNQIYKIDLDLKIDSTAQPAIEAILNAINLIYHFYKNNINIRSYITSYFQNSKLLQFQNNLVFNSNMDNVFGVYVATTFFFEGQTAIGSRNFNLLEQLQKNQKYNNEMQQRQLLRATVMSSTVKPTDTCKPVTTTIDVKSSSSIISALCFNEPKKCGIALKTSKTSKFLKDTCYRCSNTVCSLITKGGK